MSKLAIHIVTWNGAKFLNKLFQQLDIQSYSDFVVRLHDNNSTDGSYELIKKWQGSKPNVTVSRSASNLGFSGGHNELFKNTEEDFVILFNQDVSPEPNYVEVLFNAITNTPDAGSASGVLLRNKINKIDSAGLMLRRNHSGSEITTDPMTDIKEVFGVSGAAPIYRMRALRQVAYEAGIFSDKFHSYKEDVDIAYRLRLAGWKSIIVREAKARHERSMKEDGLLTRKKHKKVSKYMSYRNHLLFLSHTAQFSWFSATGFSVLLYEIAKLCWITAFEHTSLRALKEVWSLRADSKNKSNQVKSAIKNVSTVSYWYGRA